MTEVEACLEALRGQGTQARAEAAAAQHKVARLYLGVPVPEIDALVAEWRAAHDIDGRVALAQALWQSDIHEARIAAAKLLTQARLRPDTAVWDCVAGWVDDFDAWAIADHAAKAIDRRLQADPGRIEVVETWLDSANPWAQRAALVATLPWTRQNFPKPRDLEIRDRVLGWAARLAEARDPLLQRAVAWWLRDLSRHDPDRVTAWLVEHGDRLRPFARREATRHLSPSGG
ncbi:DNA alkylation repair protein [Phaeovulum vinaykumarii]|uniref:DNA alkylation repair enzyme n=1 Tax=Phaeovulum vinaykumarii TaxID=407234 RepID=A0A1N7LLJ0_9RHOB|nr:DNA alkylation repair protein [Phaeovulum vinaykumarii]SIS74649.1 DNA alkylation repair enzyme [Phaeovulum vinaykumarii]SOC05170.1 DNA alkylation repair enzyme [Phaeovulum vinaykumarii]